MCGIYGYIGPQNVVKTTINGLKKLEYRGYDSAGIAGVSDGKIIFCKEKGKIAVLEKELATMDFHCDVAIAHTRWATHGQPNKINAHPHLDTNRSLAVVHNGIIENYESLKKTLISQGAVFISETDTEVAAQLIASLYKGDILQAVQQAVPRLKGAYAFAIIHEDFPDRIVAVSHGCPLIVGIGKDEAFVSSDTNAFLEHTREVVFLEHSEIAVIQTNKLEIFDVSLAQVSINQTTLNTNTQDVEKGNFEHYTLKEIFEQPQTIRNALLSRFREEYGTAYFEELSFTEIELLGVTRILILACGTSWHAGCIAAYMFEDLARIPAQVEIASEFRYKNPVIPSGTLVIAISQSGETADTIAAVRELKAKGSKILAICNVEGSTLVRESDSCLFLRAGPEIGVCSTKAFVSQIIVLSLFCLMMARMRHLSKHEGQKFLESLKQLPIQVEHILVTANHIKAVADKYTKYENFFYLGRRYMFPTALEGALKLKEIAYINANGYPAGEMKHGPIALINEECPTMALCANKATYQKLLSNLMEVKARNGLVIAIAEYGDEGLINIVNDILWTPTTIDELAPILTTIVTQLFAYYVAYQRGADIDQPRNLAKSVTVE